MKRLTATLILILAFAGSAISQSIISVNGTITDKQTGLPIADASVVIDGTSIGTKSDHTGSFKIDITDRKQFILTISRIGYNSRSTDIDLNSFNPSSLSFKLAPTTIKVKNLNVTANRFAEESFDSPVSISVTSSEQFASRNSSSTAEVLREEPGILVQKTTHGHGAPIIRGLIGSHVLLLYNGIRLNRPTFRMGGNQYLNTVDLSSLDRIEIVRGPSSVMYGSDALGGAVNLIPDLHPIASKILSVKTKLSGKYSTADNGFSGNINFTGNSYPLATFFNINYKNIDDLRAGGNIGAQKPTGWDEMNLTGKMYYFIDEKNSLHFDYLSVKQNDVPRYDKYVSESHEQYIYDPQNRDLLGITYCYHNKDSKIQEIKSNLSYSYEKEGRIEQKTNSTTIKNSLDKLSTYGTYLQMSINLNAQHKLAIGSEYYYNSIRSQTISTVNEISESIRPTYPDKSKYYQAGLFIQHNWALFENVKLISGLRYSSIRLKSRLELPYGTVDETYNDLTGSVALSYKIVTSVNLTTRWSRGFRAPSLNDVAVLKTSSSGIDIPSIGLNPEYSDNFEIGMKVNTATYSSNLFLFYNSLNDLIDRAPGVYNGMTFEDLNDNGILDDDEASYFKRENVTSAYIYGAEYDGHLTINDWQLNANLFYTYGQNKTDSEPLSRIPPLMGLFGLRYNHTSDNWYEIFIRSAVKQDRLSARDLDDTRINNNGTPGWMTINIRTQHKVKNYCVTLTLENIFDRSYKEHGSGIYSPGRNLMLSIQYGQ